MIDKVIVIGIAGELVNSLKTRFLFGNSAFTICHIQAFHQNRNFTAKVYLPN